MKCPACVKAKQTSCVYPGHGMTTCLAGAAPYYDERGRFHYHDPNWSTMEFSCSQGHRWQERTRPGCEACGTEEEREVSELPVKVEVIDEFRWEGVSLTASGLELDGAIVKSHIETRQ